MQTVRQCLAGCSRSYLHCGHGKKLFSVVGPPALRTVYFFPPGCLAVSAKSFSLLLPSVAFFRSSQYNSTSRKCVDFFWQACGLPRASLPALRSPRACKKKKKHLSVHILTRITLINHFSKQYYFGWMKAYFRFFKVLLFCGKIFYRILMNFNSPIFITLLSVKRFKHCRDSYFRAGCHTASTLAFINC